MELDFCKLHTTILGEQRIVKNLDLKIKDVLGFCKSEIKNSTITEKGKNFYCQTKTEVFVVNKTSLTIITAHKTHKKEK